MPSALVPLLGLATAVAAVWLRHHFFLLPGDWSATGFALGISAALIFPLALYSRFRTIPWRVRIPRLASMAAILGLTVIVFNAQTFGIGLLPGHDALLPLNAWGSANLSFLSKLGTVLAAFALFTVCASAIGYALLGLFRFETDDRSGYVQAARLMTGSAVIAISTLGLGVSDQLSPGAIWIGIAASIAIGWRHIASLIRWCFGSDIWTIDARRPTFFIAALGCFLIALSLGETIRPAPTGYDDMTYYMDRVQRMQDSRTLITGGYPFPFELLSTAFAIAGRDTTMMFALAVGAFGLILGSLFLAGFGRAILGTEAGLAAAVIALSVPMGSALAFLETKPDAWLFPVATLFFWSLVRWLGTGHSAPFLFASFLLGFAVTLKLTALFLLAPLFIAGLIAAIRGIMKTRRKRMRTGLFALVCCLLPIFPWLWLAESTRPDDHPRRIETMLSSHAPSEPSLKRDIDTLLAASNCQPTGREEDLNRFTAIRPAGTGILFLPWDLTMNLSVRLFATEFGLLFLALLPIWIWHELIQTRRPIRERLGSPMIQIALFAAGFMLLWVSFAERVSWYGYPVIALFALLIAALADQVRTLPSPARCVIIGILLLGLCSNVLVRLSFAGTPERLRFASGASSTETYLDSAFPGLRTIRTALNRPDEPRVYVAGSRLWYTIDDRSARAYNDSRLDTFACFLDTYGADGTFQQLAALDIRYVLFPRSLLHELDRHPESTLGEKVRRFTEFSGQHLRVVWGSPHYLLLEPGDTGRR